MARPCVESLSRVGNVRCCGAGLEEIAPDDKTHNEVLGARVNLDMAAKKWDMVTAVASHLAKVAPKTAGWWISLAYAIRGTQSVEKAEAILLRAQKLHPKVAMIAFNLACYASVTGRTEEAKERLRHAMDLDKDILRTGARRGHYRLPGWRQGLGLR